MKIFVTLVSLLFSAILYATPLNKVVVFGDSLSDNGNLYEYMKHQLPVSPPYFDGRFTNGYVWVELLMQSYYPANSNEHLLDYAFGGAGVMDNDDDEGLFTLRREIDSYFLAHEDKADDRSLYIVWIGSNNYLGAPDDGDAVVNEVNSGVRHSLERLVKKGAKHVMVVTLPDLGNTPAARDFDSVSTMSYLSQQHNKMLEKNINELQSLYPETQWIFFEVNQVLEDIMANPKFYGFTNVKDTCYEEVMDNSLSKKYSILKMVASVKSRKNKNACDGYLFFDPVHPTEPVHQLMAERTKVLLEENGIVFE